MVGLLVATFLRGVVATSADRVGLSYAQHLANGCYYVFALLTFIAAFHQGEDIHKRTAQEIITGGVLPSPSQTIRVSRP